MKAYHFLKADMRTDSGDEKPWEVGEERTVANAHGISLCNYGYHSSPSLWNALMYAPGSMACLVEISKPIAKDDTKQVSATRKLIKAVNIDRELRLFAADCAERVLYIFEKEHPGDDRPRQAIQAARDFANGKIDVAAKDAARAAGAAARDAARAAGAAAGAAGAAAWDAEAAAWAAEAAARAAGAAAWAAGAAARAAGAAAGDDERKWQREHFEQMFGGLFK